MLRLSLLAQTPAEVVVRLDGWVTEEEIPFLKQEGTRWRQRTRRLVLDLSGVPFIDRDGLELLKSWSGPQLVLRGGSLFVRVLLARHGLAVEDPPQEDPASP